MLDKRQLSRHKHVLNITDSTLYLCILSFCFFLKLNLKIINKLKKGKLIKVVICGKYINVNKITKI